VPLSTLCEETNHKAHIRNSLLSMQSIACHFIDCAMYPYGSIHVTSKLSQTKKTKTANSVLCDIIHRLPSYFQNVTWFHGTHVNIIPLMPIKKVQPFMQQLPQNSQILSNIMYRPLILSFSQVEQYMWKICIEIQLSMLSKVWHNVHETHTHSLNFCGYLS
jgi:hypothetical protein